MDFIGDYWEYNRRYEIARNYSFISGLCLLGAIVNRKVVFFHGDIELHGNLYALMVGPQGNGKSTANDLASGLFFSVCPDYEIGASTQSAEDIVTTMSKEGFAKSFTNHLGEMDEVRAYAFFINEFKDFIAYSPTRMLNFLGNIYDRKFFKASTIKRGLENIVNPCLNILGCENPDQLIRFMKTDIMTGGISRRFILVYEPGYAEAKPFIEKNDELRAKLVARLQDVRKVVGQFQWCPTGRKFYEPWYIKKQSSLASIENSIMRGYVSTKHVQLFKICMLLDVVSDKPMFLFTDELLQFGLSFLDVFEPNMPKLSLASGRNELMGSQQKVLEMLEQNGGMLPEKQLMKLVEVDLKPFEIPSMFRHLIDSGQVVKKEWEIPNGEGIKIPRMMIILTAKWNQMIKDKEIEVKKKEKP